MKLQDKIRNIRLEHNMSQVALAKLIGASPTSVSYWESGLRSPKIEQLMKIADAFLINWTDLLDDDAPMLTMVIAKREESLLDAYKSLNEEGKQMLLTFAQSLVYNPLYGNGEGSIKDAYLYDGAKNQKALEDLTEEEKVTLASHPSTKEKK